MLIIIAKFIQKTGCFSFFCKSKVKLREITKSYPPMLVDICTMTIQRKCANFKY